MTRKIQYKIGREDHGKKIEMFLKEKEYSRAVLIELKRTQQGIRKNNEWARVNEVLQIDDTLEICIEETCQSDNIIPKQYDLEVLYEDEDLLVLNKSYNTPIHPSLNNYDNTLANAVMYYAKMQNNPYVFRCINRLDRDTTGVTIIAKNIISASILGNKMKEQGLKRIYVALVEGITKEEETIDLPIGREEDSIIKRKIDSKQGKPAVTHYRRLDVIEVEGKKVSLVALQLETGRTHQIRVHMTAIGHPLLGDFLYNENNHMLTRQALHGVQCGFIHPITGTQMLITAPLPKDMRELIQKSDKDNEVCCDLQSKLRNIKW